MYKPAIDKVETLSAKATDFVFRFPLQREMEENYNKIFLKKLIKWKHILNMMNSCSYATTNRSSQSMTRLKGSSEYQRVIERYIYIDR